MRFRVQVPSPEAETVLAEMLRSGYDVTLQAAAASESTRELTLWVFAGQSVLQAELLLTKLAPGARLLPAAL